MTKLIYNKYINTLLRFILKPISKILPINLKFPVNGIITIKLDSTKSFKISSNPTCGSTKILFWEGIKGFEYSSVKIFMELSKTSAVFFDIGSNVGYYSLLATSISNKKINAYAFEPMPSAFEYLKENVFINNFENIKPQCLALSNQNGEAVFYQIINEKFKQFPQLTGDGGLSKSQSGNRTKVNFNVKIKTLDSFVVENLGDVKIDLIKLDTEANEHNVLAGAHSVLMNQRPIIQSEILKNQIEMEVEVILNKYNYNYYRATDKGLIQVNTFLNNETNFCDYYLVPKEKINLIERFIK